MRPVEAGQPSATARGVAAARRHLTRPASAAGDPDADQRLQAAVSVAHPVPPERLLRYLTARTRFFDDQTMGALAAGTAEVVLVGAGYDGRALRFRSPGVRFFELDHPSTQADKRDLLARVGADLDDVTLVPADFVIDDVAVALARAGHDDTAVSFFLCEGVVPYLPEDVTAALLRALRSRAAGQSRLVVDFALRGADGQVAAGGAELDRRVARAGEPIRTRLDAADATALVEAAGWRVTDATDIAQLDTAITPARSLLVTGTAA